MFLDSYTTDQLDIEIFRDELIDERTYLIKTNHSALIIDPHFDEDLFERLGDIPDIRVFLTHEHYDHISGVNAIKSLGKCNVYASRICADIICREDNGTKRYPLLFICDREKYDYIRKTAELPYVTSADVAVEKEESLDIDNINIRLILTPGHSEGGMSLLVNDTYLFTGDNLLGNGMELKSIGSDEPQYIQTIALYEKLPGETIVFPGHGDINTLEYYIKRVKDYYKWN